jgi:hypothetical protein
VGLQKITGSNKEAEMAAGNSYRDNGAQNERGALTKSIRTPGTYTNTLESVGSVKAPIAPGAQQPSVPKEMNLGTADVLSRSTRPPTERTTATVGESLQKPEDNPTDRSTQLPTQTAQGLNGVIQERKHMRRKWFELGHKTEQQMGANSPAILSKPAPPAFVTSTAVQTRPAEIAEDAAERPEIELLSVSDIYQTAGILNPRKGYSILKVAEMLRSEHLRGLSRELKRATVMVALDAAGITVAEVAEDAKARVAAIDAYEAEQRKQFEAHLARKAQENQHIMAELERIKASYAEKLRRNLEGIAREKATFGSWLTAKEQEGQNIAEALDLFTARPEAAAAGNSALDTTLVSPSAKPV